MALKRPQLIIPAALLIVAVLVYLLFFRGQPVSPDTLRLSGHIEATQTDLGFKVPGKIAAIHFYEGDAIKAGQTAAALEDQDLREDVAQAEGALGAARANLAKLLAGSRPQEKKESSAAVAQAKADLVDKEREFRRMQALFERRTVSAQTRDRAEAAYLMAKEAHRRAGENYSLVLEGPRKEDIDAARAEVRRTEAALALARTRLGYATIACPINAVVLVRPMEPGEVAAIGSPVLTLGDLDNAYFEGYVPETDLAKVRYGQKAEITTDSYPGKKYPGRVYFVSSKAEFTPKTVETHKERVTLVYRTKIRVENQDHSLKPGMPADALIFLKDQPR
ncbi:MAG: efflux RND transporter periplasmic adaptor subunit [Thermodesulfobacteriota bacterium]